MASIVLKFYSSESVIFSVPPFDVASHRLHRSCACAAGLQAAASTVESKEPNILANYSRA
jgi:hypothetical protein